MIETEVMNELVMTLQKTSALLVRMDPKQKQRLLAAARRRKRPAASLVRDLIEEMLNRK